MIYSEKIKVKIKSQDFFDITDKVESIVRKMKIKKGLCNIFVLGATSAVLLNENEPMLLQDLKKSLEKIAPENSFYHHAENAYSHIRSVFIGNSQTIPIEDGKLVLGTWQSILIANFDTFEREREIVITITGE